MRMSNACSSCMNAPTDHMQSKFKPGILVSLLLSSLFFGSLALVEFCIHRKRSEGALSQERRAEATHLLSSPLVKDCLGEVAARLANRMCSGGHATPQSTFLTFTVKVFARKMGWKNTGRQVAPSRERLGDANVA